MYNIVLYCIVLYQIVLCSFPTTRDKNALVNPTRIFLLLTYHCCKEDDTAISLSDNVTPLTPLSHSSITSIVVNVAECEIQSVQKVYHIWAKLHYLLQIPEEARKTHKAFFEGFWNESISEKVRLN